MAASKANARRHSKDEAHYRAQFMVTYRNKTKRIKKSNGETFLAAWAAKFYPIALAKSTGKSRPS